MAFSKVCLKCPKMTKVHILFWLETQSNLILAFVQLWLQLLSCCFALIAHLHIYPICSQPLFALHITELYPICTAHNYTITSIIFRFILSMCILYFLQVNYQEVSRYYGGICGKQPCITVTNIDGEYLNGLQVGTSGMFLFSDVVMSRRNEFV